VAAVVAITAFISILLSGYWILMVVPAPAPDLEPSGDLVTSVYDPPTSSVEESLTRGDGQIFAAQATDPFFRDRQLIAGGAAEQAYRYQRPLYGWLGWIVSAGQPGAVAWAMVGITIVSIVALLAVSAKWMEWTGADPRLALALLATPGVFVDLIWVGPEALGTALVVFGLARWFGLGRGTKPRIPKLEDLVPNRVDTMAITAFGAAGLCRESLLVVPAVLAIAAVQQREWPIMRAAASSALPYLLWIVVLHQIFGEWPKGAVPGRMSVVPFGGLLSAASSWGPGDWLFAVAILALAIVALVLGRTSALAPLIAVHLALAMFLGEPVWIRFADFGRVLLPLTVLSVLAIAPLGSKRREVLQAPLNPAT